MVGTYNSADDHPIVKAVTNLIGPEVFWKSEEDRFVSKESLEKNAHVVELVMTYEQFAKLLYNGTFST